MNTIHDRFFVTQRARNDLHKAVVKVWECHGLTDLEVIQMVSDLSASVIGRVTRPMLREERHPGQPDRAADLE